MFIYTILRSNRLIEGYARVSNVLLISEYVVICISKAVCFQCYHPPPVACSFGPHSNELFAFTLDVLAAVVSHSVFKD